MALTSGGLPYPVGTDKVVDGDDAIKALALALDPRVDDTGWINTGLAWSSGVGPGSATGGWQPAKYRRIGKYVRLNGTVGIGGGVPAFSILVTVPAAIRPAVTFVGAGDYAVDIIGGTGAVRVRIALPTAGEFGVDVAWLLG